MKKGVLDMLVLKLLEKEPMYGYQLIQEMAQLSRDVFSLKEGTLYPILYRLEDEIKCSGPKKKEIRQQLLSDISEDRGEQKAYGNLPDL